MDQEIHQLCASEWSILINHSFKFLLLFRQQDLFQNGIADTYWEKFLEGYYINNKN